MRNYDCLSYNNFEVNLKGGVNTPFSVTMPVISSGGVISKAGLKVRTPFAEASFFLSLIPRQHVVPQ